jgi:HAD superfamily hydrolase (TIGR01509 family)
MKLEEINSIAFDLDGTLCYYSISIQEAMENAFQQIRKPVDWIGNLDQAAARYNELWAEEEMIFDRTRSFRERAWDRLLQEHGVNEPGLARLVSDAYTRIRVPSIRLFDGASDLLNGLKRRHRLGLLTNGPTDIQWEKIERLELKGLFDTIVVSGDVGVYKPDVRIFELLLGRLGVTAEGSLYVGDSYPMDIVGAKEAGMWAAWVRQGQANDSQACRPDLEVESIGELREILL